MGFPLSLGPAANWVRRRAAGSGSGFSEPQAALLHGTVHVNSHVLGEAPSAWMQFGAAPRGWRWKDYLGAGHKQKNKKMFAATMNNTVKLN